MMQTRTADLLACPDLRPGSKGEEAKPCRGALILAEADGDPIRSGILRCGSCGREFPIQKGIPHFFRSDELTGLNRRFARLYDRLSHVYRPVSTLLFAFLGGEARYRREILDRLEPHGGRLLEVSIGPGVNLPYLAERADVGAIYGLDISLGQLERCQGFARRRHWPVELFLGNAEQLPFKDGSFESVFHIGGINFFNDKKRAIEEMIRVAAPGTRIIIVDETEKGARVYRRASPGFERLFDGDRAAVSVPVDMVPPAMKEVRVDTLWRGFLYSIEFRKP
jgi:ubiquinone/menaquinone biosynthesis C-methylase UbiE